ncbi:M20/M25/M40 family metallo-hydrolase [Bacteroidota bacterium]
MKRTSLLLIVLLSVFTASAQEIQKGLDAITRRAVEGQVEFLASDWTEGRETGTKGAYMSADYIASIYKLIGLEPGGDIEWIHPDRAGRIRGEKSRKYRSYFQNFSLIEYKPGELQEFSLYSGSTGSEKVVHFNYRTDFSVSTSEVGIELTSPIVFVGYGYVNEDLGYDDFKNVDVKDKIILRLAGYPGHDDTSSVAYRKINPDGNLNSRRMYRSKNEAASERGAAAIIEVEPYPVEDDGYWADNIPFRYNSRMYEGTEPTPVPYGGGRMRLPGNEISGNPTSVTISNRVLNSILDGSGIDLKKFAETVKNTMKPASVAVLGKKVRINTSVDSRIVRVRNVIGVIPGKDTGNMVIIGGHYDHMGIRKGYIWNGADDNASGTVGTMTVARACMATGVKPEKTMVFAAWTAEEKGLIGSRYFAQNPYKNLNMMAYLNYDMISRDNSDDSLGVKCSLNYTKAYPLFEEMTDRHNEEYGLGLEINYHASEKPGGGSDHSSFANVGVPIFYFEAGFPPEYHQPDDTPDRINWDKMVNIIKVGFLNMWELANSDWDKD